jgi:DNA-binding transcriptional regulator YiaG
MEAETQAVLGLRLLMRSGQARSIRRRAGMSLRWAATEARVTPGTLSKWENGHHAPRGEGALRYAKLLDELATLAGDS